MAVLDWPDQAAAVDLYARLAGGDRVASSDLAAAFLDPLVGYLRAKFPYVDDHSLFTAAGDALLSLIHNPAVFDPSRGDLGAFLKMAARGDLLNALRREQKHQDHRVDQDCVELGTDDGNMSQEDEDLPSFDDPDLVTVVASLTDAERRVLDLMRAGEKRTAVIAEALGVADRPFAEQQHEVKRAKDRIIKRLKRAKGGT